MDDPQKTADRQILAALSRGAHRRALELLARAHAPALGRLCFAMTGDQAVAEELTQEILIQAYQAMPAFEGRAGLRTWLYIIARRTCSRAVQKRRRRLRLLAGAHPIDAAPRSGEEELEARRRLQRAMAQLSPQQQETLLLHHVSGLSYREVGGVCGVREDTARQRAAAGINKLRRLLAVEPRRGATNRRRRVVAACQELSS